MRYLLLAVSFMFLAGCATQNREVASDADEGIHETVMSHMVHPKAGI